VESHSSAILLDTHTVLWLVSAPVQVSAAAREQIADSMREVMVSAVSAVSAWEVAIKTRLGVPLDRMVVAQAQVTARVAAQEFLR
jgi:PIN domain nuclease of toxin-antitoxin system